MKPRDMTDFYTPIDKHLLQSVADSLSDKYDCPIWITRDGCAIPVSEMKSSHMMNGFRMLLTKLPKLAEEGNRDLFLYWYERMKAITEYGFAKGLQLIIPTAISQIGDRFEQEFWYDDEDWHELIHRYDTH